MNYFIGIDPGQKGALSIISHYHYDDNKFIHVIDMPLFPSKEINTIGVREFFSVIISRESICYIEKAQSMPRQGVTSTFNYGQGYGKLKAVLEILGISYQEISPQLWKKEFSLIKKDKKDSVTVAMKLFPEITFKTPKGRLLDGRAESLLIAEYCRRKNL